MAARGGPGSMGPIPLVRSQGDGPTREAGEADDVPSNGARHVCGRIGPGGIEGPPSEAGLEQA